MKEACIGGDQTFIADDQAAEVAQPHEGALGDQARGPLTGASRRAGPADGNGVERPVETRAFCWGSRLQGCSQRRTRAIAQTHPLGALAPLGLADVGPPGFAGMKRPSAQHSSPRRFCWSFSWAQNTRQRWQSTPVSSQAFSRRQQVLGRPYRRGRSPHWAPVHSIQRMPSTPRRSSTRGRPPRADTVGSGRWTRMASPWCVVSPRHAISCRLRFPGHAGRDDTLTGRF